MLSPTAGNLPALPKKTASGAGTVLGGSGGSMTQTVQQAAAAAMAANTYTFASEPRAVPSQRKKYREPTSEKEQRPVNIMHDRRIHRGNTYAYPVLPLNAQQDPVEVQKQSELKKRLRAKRRADYARKVRTPEAVEGRKHIEIQTDLYLEELSDTVPEAYASTQTDTFIDRAPSPVYIPQKSGVDAATQILEGELFDFDYEVQPILEVLVGKTLEQAVMECMEEQELETLKRHQEEHEKKRNAELTEIQRLEDAERRKTEEKERRLAESLRLQRDNQEVSEKIAARAFAQSYLANLIPSVFDNLTNNGYFYDVVQREVETQFLPWLTGQVEKSLNKQQLATRLLDDLIRTALISRQNGQ